MAVTTKSPARVLQAALAVARRSLPAYSHRYSPKKFTQHQLFACLVLKSFWRTDYRGVVAQLEDSPSLLEVLGLERVPHYTTLQKAARRLLKLPSARKLLDVTVREQMRRRRRVSLAAIDSTGMECTAASGYFVRRRASVSSPWKSVFIAFVSIRACISRVVAILDSLSSPAFRQNAPPAVKSVTADYTNPGRHAKCDLHPLEVRDRPLVCSCEKNWLKCIFSELSVSGCSSA